jgi:putative nucleotidyltransferase with HDIG domain
MDEIKLSTEHLQVGNYIRLPLTWHDHPFLLSNFMIRNQEQIEIIKKLGIQHVYINIKKSRKPPKIEQPEIYLHEEEDDNTYVDDLMLDKMQSKDKCIEQLKNHKESQKRAEQGFKYSFEKIKDLMRNTQGYPLRSMREAQALTDYIASQLHSTSNITLHLMADTPNNDSLYYHALNVATLSMLLAKLCNKSYDEIKMVGLAAIFHDIGNSKISPHVFKKSEDLTKPEENLYKMHATYSLRLLEMASDFPNDAKEIIANHHERLDGSGYPKGLIESDINDLTQLLSVVDEYDYMCNPLLKNKTPVTPYTALSFLYKHCDKKLNKKYVQALIKQLGVYPPGCVVELSNGHIGLVLSINSKRTLYPKLMIYDQHVPKEQAAIIDLEELSLTIKRVLLPSRLPKEIFDYLQPRKCIGYFFDTATE